MSIVQYTVNKPIKPKTKMQMLKDAKKDLNRALEHSPKDESVLFLRGILNFALHRFYDAISDFERVIEKAEETNALHYLARGVRWDIAAAVSFISHSYQTYDGPGVWKVETEDRQLSS